MLRRLRHFKFWLFLFAIILVPARYGEDLGVENLAPEKARRIAEAESDKAVSFTIPAERILAEQLPFDQNRLPEARAEEPPGRSPDLQKVARNLFAPPGRNTPIATDPPAPRIALGLRDLEIDAADPRRNSRIPSFAQEMTSFIEPDFALDEPRFEEMEGSDGSGANAPTRQGADRLAGEKIATLLPPPTPRPKPAPVEFPIDDAPTPPRRSLLLEVDHIHIDKSARALTLRSEGRDVIEYRVALGFSPKGQKLREGDGRTPTGEYVIDWRNDESDFYRSLHISYPRADQKARARSEGRNPGGMIMIHGQPNLSPYRKDRKIKRDWTDGCIALSNNEMDEIWELVKNGTSITIVE